MDSKNFIQNARIQGSPATVSLVINILSQSKECNVLDIGGGNGNIYWVIRPFLSNAEKVSWHVVDNSDLINQGRKFCQVINDSYSDINISFSDNFGKSAHQHETSFLHEKISPHSVHFLLINYLIVYLALY